MDFPVTPSFLFTHLLLPRRAVRSNKRWLTLSVSIQKFKMAIPVDDILLWLVVLVTVSLFGVVINIDKMEVSLSVVLCYVRADFLFLCDNDQS